MTAKPQPMAGQSDAADDLIAELAKLMAQDAQTERPAQPAVPAFSVRIPGGEAEKPAAPAPSIDFLRASTPPARPVAEPVPSSQLAARPQSTLVEAAPEPFRFDFGAAPKREPVDAAPPALVAVPQAAVPQPIAAQSVAPQPAPVADHDSIADLIAAELRDDPTPAPVSAPTRTNEPVVSSEPRPAPIRSGGWAPTTVAANLGGNSGQQRAAIRPVNLQPASRSEQDQFKVPPVFGLGTTQAPEPKAPVFEMPSDLPMAPDAALAQPEYVQPQPVSVAPVAVEPPVARQPAAPAPVVVAPPQPTRNDDLGLDPIDEIESLIGRAMRVEFDKPVTEARPAPSPALRSLATPTIPAPSTAPSSPHALSGADEAIFAAAQATGAQVGWVEAPEVSEPDPVSRKRPKAERAPRAFGMTRALAGPLVAITLLLAAGFGLYWVLGLKGESGPAPLLTADATPTKETPAVQPDAAASQQSVVFNEMDGVVPGAEEQLVSRDQSDVNEVTQVAATPDLSEEGLANRKVRTVTVRPDGTIVSGDDSVAGSAILPVDRPNVPVVPGAETASPELLASATPEPVTPAPAPAAEPTPAVTPAQPGSTVPAFDLAGNAIAGKTTVVPLLRPSTFAQPAAAATNTRPPAPVNAFVDPAAAVAPVSADLQVPAATAPVTQPATIPAGATEVAAVGNDAPAYVQLASQRSEEEARATASAMVTRFGPLFGGANMEVQRVDLGAKGIYYRVRVPASSIQDANNMCTNVKAAGGDCFTM